jgi:hypothetical protein
LKKEESRSAGVGDPTGRLFSFVSLTWHADGGQIVKAKGEILIGKFDILATYAYAQALAEGASEADAKQRGIVAAIMGAKVKLGYAHDHKAEQAAAEKKNKKTITAEDFDRQVAEKLGPFFERTFLPAVKKMVEEHVSYEGLKRKVRIPLIWGAKITADDFIERITSEKNLVAIDQSATIKPD